ncbi:MAG: hypothetical protein ACR5LD_00755 [Symbiopectobacterium sp.]
MLKIIHAGLHTAMQDAALSSAASGISHSGTLDTPTLSIANLLVVT